MLALINPNAQISRYESLALSFHSLEAFRNEIVGAIDFLITGV